MRTLLWRWFMVLLVVARKRAIVTPARRLDNFQRGSYRTGTASG
jgi:hypothetical protein